VSGTPPPERPVRHRLAELDLGADPMIAGAGRGGGEGVRTRDHLANVRTFLSWMRLAFGLVTVGFAVDKFGVVVAQFKGVAVEHAGGDRPTALGLVLAGGVVANLAFGRFLLQRRVIESPDLRSRVILDVVVFAIAGVVGILVILFLVRTGV